MADISIIFPIHNEEHLLAKHTPTILNFLEQADGIDAFEILLCPNGCVDRTEDIAWQLAEADPRIRSFPKPERGIGVGLKEGIRHCQYEFAMFYAIDLPFGLEIIPRSVLEAKQHHSDLVIGSKAHPDSVVHRTLQRRVFSNILHLILNVCFGLKVGDTQGSLLWRTSCMERILPALTSDTAFLETQIVIYFRAMGFAILEIPIANQPEFRSSRIPIIKESTRIIREILYERRILQRTVAALKE